MALQLCVLASGSSANCTLIANESTRLLIDAGLSLRETVARLATLDVAAESLTAVCVTHEHADHQTSLGALQRKFGVGLYANAPTVEALERKTRLRDLDWNIFTTGQPFTIGDLSVLAFSVPHDSYEPVGFVVSDGQARIGVVTDMGLPTESIRQRLKNCDALVLECNHDEELLHASSRPWSLKQRIAGRQGHLSNRQAADLIADVAGTRLQTVLLAHLSQDCNRPELALATCRKRLASAQLDRVTLVVTSAGMSDPVVVRGPGADAAAGLI